jgi:hypothetical protein
MAKPTPTHIISPGKLLKHLAGGICTWWRSCSEASWACSSACCSSKLMLMSGNASGWPSFDIALDGWSPLAPTRSESGRKRLRTRARPARCFAADATVCCRNLVTGPRSQGLCTTSDGVWQDCLLPADAERTRCCSTAGGRAPQLCSPGLSDVQETCRWALLDQRRLLRPRAWVAGKLAEGARLVAAALADPLSALRQQRCPCEPRSRSSLLRTLARGERSALAPGGYQAGLVHCAAGSGDSLVLSAF